VKLDQKREPLSQYLSPPLVKSKGILPRRLSTSGGLRASMALSGLLPKFKPFIVSRSK